MNKFGGFTKFIFHSYIHGAPVRSGIVHDSCMSDLVEGIECFDSIAEDINTTTTTTKRQRRQDNYNDDDTARRATFNAGHVDAKNLPADVFPTSPNLLSRAQLPSSRPLPSVIGTGQAVCQYPEHRNASSPALAGSSREPVAPVGNHQAASLRNLLYHHFTIRIQGGERTGT